MLAVLNSSQPATSQRNVQIPKHYNLTSFLSFCLRQDAGSVPEEVCALAGEFQDTCLSDNDVNTLSTKAAAAFKTVRDKGVEVHRTTALYVTMHGLYYM